MSIFGADYEFVDLLEIMEDLDMNENRIRDLRNMMPSIKDIRTNGSNIKQRI